MATEEKAKRKTNMPSVKPDEVLAKVIGDQPAPRTEITSRVWAYIKKNNLQDPANKRMINADESLKAVFDGKGQVDMFEMTSLVNKHLQKI